MSAESQKEFLGDLLVELEKSGFRALSNKRAYNVTVELSKIEEAIVATVEELVPTATEEEKRLVLRKMSTASKRFFITVRNGLREYVRTKKDSRFAEEEPGIPIDTPTKVQVILQNRGGDGELRNQHEQVYDIYGRRKNKAGNTPQSRLHESLQQALLDVFELKDKDPLKLSEKNPRKRKRVIDIEHANLKGVVETKVTEKVDEAVARSSAETLDSVQEFLESQGVELSLFRERSEEYKDGIFEEMEVHIGSKAINALDAVESAARFKHLTKVLKDSIEKLDTMILGGGAEGPGLAHLKGSDSPAKRRQKEAVNRVLLAFKKGGAQTDPLFKINTKDSSTRLKQKGNPRALALPRGAKTGSKSNLKISKGSSAANSPLQMIVNFNKRLPAVVQKNMKAPALEYDTGRFAESVKVTDVTQTPKGFPSIGYTYDRDNYEQFEATSGSKQFASHDRDPRRLIDRSIREIARELAMGRFFTRRV